MLCYQLVIGVLETVLWVGSKIMGFDDFLGRPRLEYGNDLFILNQ